jgi:hypothetical protein
MIIKAGILVFCQFFLSTDKIDIKDGESVAHPREMIGMVINVKKEKIIRTEKKDGKVFAIEDEKTMLEVEGTEPQPMHFLINENACTIVQTKAEVEKQKSEVEQKNNEIKKKNLELIAKEKSDIIAAAKLKKKQSHKFVKKEEKKPDVEFIKDSNGKEIKIDISDMDDFKYKAPTPVPPSPTPAPVFNYTKPEVEVSPTPEVTEVIAVVPEEKNTKKDPVKVEAKPEVKTKESGVKAMFKDIFNNFKK